MRVAHVCADPGIPVWGSKGASVHVQEVVRALRRRGDRVELLCMRRGGQPPADLADVRVHRLQRPPRSEPRVRERALIASDRVVARALAALASVDLVYERCSLFATAAMAHAARNGVPGILELNAPLTDEHARHRGLVHHGEAERAMRNALADASTVIAVSEAVAAWARVRTDRPERVHVVANGVDTGRIRPRPRTAGPGGDFMIGFLGTLKPWHGTETLLEALALLASREQGWRLLLVGDGPQAPVLREQATRLGLADSIEWTGAVTPSAVPAQLARFDVAVAPYPAGDGTYCSPLKLYEYMAAGLPIVAGRTAAASGVLRDGDTGVLVDPDDPIALATALAALRADPARSTALGRAARRLAVREHSWQDTVERILLLAGAGAATAGRAAA